MQPTKIIQKKLGRLGMKYFKNFEEILLDELERADKSGYVKDMKTVAHNQALLIVWDLQNLINKI